MMKRIPFTAVGNDEHGKFWLEVAVSTILIIGTQVICEN